MVKYTTLHSELQRKKNLNMGQCLNKWLQLPFACKIMVVVISHIDFIYFNAI